VRCAGYRTLSCPRCQGQFPRDVIGSQNILAAAFTYWRSRCRPQYLSTDYSWKYGTVLDAEHWAVPASPTEQSIPAPSQSQAAASTHGASRRRLPSRHRDGTTAGVTAAPLAVSPGRAVTDDSNGDAADSADAAAAEPARQRRRVITPLATASPPPVQPVDTLPRHGSSHRRAAQNTGVRPRAGCPRASAH
jgi:hypothetical protein